MSRCSFQYFLGNEMLSNESIQFITRTKICKDEKVPTIEELRDFLERLLMGFIGNFHVASTFLTISELKLILDMLISLGLQDSPIVCHFPSIGNATHYCVDSHNSTLILN